MTWVNLRFVDAVATEEHFGGDPDPLTQVENFGVELAEGERIIAIESWPVSTRMSHFHLRVRFWIAAA